MIESIWPEPGKRARPALPGGAGDIETVLSAPRTPRDGKHALLVCHPHPLYGGTMDNKVAATLASAAHDAGWYALRFNFRGVGASSGAHDEGRGEAEDCAALARWLRADAGADTVALAGFSFGGYVALRAYADIAPAALITVAPAWRYFPDGVPPVWPDCPWLVVHAQDDDVVDPDDTRRALAQAPAPPRQEWPEEAGHFFHGRLDAVRAPARALLTSLPD